MNDGQLEQELAEFFSAGGEDIDNVEALVETVWRQSRRERRNLNGAILGAALVGGGLSYFISGSAGFVPAAIASLDASIPESGAQLLAVTGIVFTLFASFWISQLAAEA